MQFVRISLITPKDALDLIGSSPFLKGLSAKTRHVYVTRALNYEPVFRKEGRGEYSIVADATMPLPLTHSADSAELGKASHQVLQSG